MYEQVDLRLKLRTPITRGGGTNSIGLILSSLVGWGLLAYLAIDSLLGSLIDPLDDLEMEFVALIEQIRHFIKRS